MAGKIPQPIFPLIRTRRWNDPTDPGDGFRLLITRYRPRGLSKADETWDDWNADLGPSRELHAAAYGKRDLLQIPWEVYRRRYLTEMLGQKAAIEALAVRLIGGERITLLCSSACDRESRCHRSLLRDLIERRARDMIVTGDGGAGGAFTAEGST